MHILFLRQCIPLRRRFFQGFWPVVRCVWGVYTWERSGGNLKNLFAKRLLPEMGCGTSLAHTGRPTEPWWRRDGSSRTSHIAFHLEGSYRMQCAGVEMQCCGTRSSSLNQPWPTEMWLHSQQMCDLKQEVYLLCLKEWIQSCYEKGNEYLILKAYFFKSLGFSCCTDVKFYPSLLRIKKARYWWSSALDLKANAGCFIGKCVVCA